MNYEVVDILVEYTFLIRFDFTEQILILCELACKMIKKRLVTNNNQIFANHQNKEIEKFELTISPFLMMTIN